MNRKAECDAYFTEGLNEGFYRLEKSTMIGSVYYAAVTGLKRYNEGKKEDVPKDEQHTFGVVFLTSVDSKDYYNFSYKDMDETCGPFCYDCPESILKLLSPTTSEFAQKWRDGCRKHRKLRKALNDLPVGSVIEFERVDGTKRYVKHAPAFQFKKPFWYNPEGHSYIPNKNIPDGYCVIKEGK